MSARRFGLAALTALSFGLAAPARAQIPAEWPAVARAILAEIEKDTPQAAKPFAANFSARGWDMARKWRLANNGNTEIILAEYMVWLRICRVMGCEGDTIGGKPYKTLVAEVKAERNARGGQEGVVDAAHAWLADRASASGASGKAAKANAESWKAERDTAAADFAASNIFTVAWMIARVEGTPEAQADAMARWGLLVQGKAWIGNRCLDIRKAAASLDGPPKIETCK